MSCFYLLMGPTQELDLARAELWALAGCAPRGRVAIGPLGVDVSRAAYVRLCGQQLAAAVDWPQLHAAIARLELRCERYRIEVVRPAPKVPVAAADLEKAIADLITGRPDLRHPHVQFAVIAAPGDWRFGQVISQSQQRWRRQARRPYHFSHALPAPMARALVNMVAAPGDTLVDPCCGLGTVVAEALADGVRALGMEINPALAQQAAANLAALGLPGNIVVGDARTCRGHFDAAVIDFPYGHSTRVAPELYADILLNLRPQVQRMALVFGTDQHRLLGELGLTVCQEARVTKGRLVRHIYVVSTKEGQSPAR